MAQPVGTLDALTGTAAAAASPARQDRPSEVMVMPMRVAEQHVLVVVGEADLHTAAHQRTQLIDRLQGQPPPVLVELRPGVLRPGRSGSPARRRSGSP